MLFKTLLFTGLHALPALAKSKINLYWGQNGNTRLAEVCAADNVDFVTITFVYQSPENSGNTNYPGTEFGAHCAGYTYTVNGESSNLLSGCTEIKEDISKCQAMGTKVLLSIGGQYDGVTANYTVSTVEKGQEFADFLWYAFGPYDPSWTGPRPFDLDATHHSSVDGFDFDIEKKFADQTPWIAMVERLREHFGGSSNYLITGAPECPLADSWFKMKQMIVAAQFDILFIQFYNNEGCDAVGEGFNFDDWTAFLAGTKSAHAKLYIGLLAYPGSGYIEHSQLKGLVDIYGTRPNFGGISVWDEYFVSRTTDTATNKTYLEAIKDALETVTPTTTITTHIPTGTPTCSNPYTVQEGEYCYSIADKYVISVSQILEQNPQLDAFCDVTPGLVLCLPPTATTTKTAVPTSTIPCAEKYTVVSGDFCYKIASQFSISYDELRELNPQLDSDCSLLIGDVLCVKGLSTSSGVSQTVTATTTTTPTATSTSAPTCNAQYTVVGGDFCYKIADQFSISYDQLRALNPWLDQDCSLRVGDVLCVSASSTSTTTTPPVITSTTAASVSGTPSPSCAATYTVVEGDYCYRISQNFGLQVSDLKLLNPWLDQDCSLRVGDVLCVSSGAASTTSGVVTTTSTSSASGPASSTPSCTETYTVQAGDYCYRIATSFNLEVPDLMLLNPWLDKDCSLRPGDVLCVKGQTSSSSSTPSTTTTSSSTMASGPVGSGASTFLTLTSTGKWNTTTTEDIMTSTALIRPDGRRFV